MVLGGQPYETTQTYVYDFGAGAVRFADGRPFHALDLSTGRARVAHDCPPDFYRGRYGLGPGDTWTLVWAISGPRKTMLIRTRYRRASPAS